MKNVIFAFSKPLAAILLASAAAGPAMAATVCETGRLTHFSHESGGSSKIVIRGDSYSPGGLSKSSLGNGKQGTVIWESGSTVRFAEIYSLVKTAYATRSHVRIVSSDENCAGPMDEFWVLVCPGKDDCDY